MRTIKNDRFSEVKHICGESTISVYVMALTAILNLFQTYAIVSYLNFYHMTKLGLKSGYNFKQY